MNANRAAGMPNVLFERCFPAADSPFFSGTTNACSRKDYAACEKTHPLWFLLTSAGPIPVSAVRTNQYGDCPPRPADCF
jgi:hypothetical protein